MYTCGQFGSVDTVRKSLHDQSRYGECDSEDNTILRISKLCSCVSLRRCFIELV